MEFAGQNVLVLGLGRTGRSAARFLAARGAHVVAADEQRPEALARGEALDELRALEGMVELRTGQPFPDAARYDAVVPSPGIAPQRFARARAVWGDIELAARALAVPVVAVTGTNGKTTTVLLLESLLRAGGLRTRAAGNVGTPALELVGQGLDVALLEVSSFQLELCHAFRPSIAVLLNVAADHLDRHGDWSSYIAAKARIFAHQRPSDLAIGSAEDATVRRLVEAAAARQQWFGRRPTGRPGAWWDGDSAWFDLGGAPYRVGLPRPLRLPIEAVLAALLVCAELGLDLDLAASALPGFPALPHRFECVAEISGVTWINDSKATNPAAALHALRQVEQPIVWIAGGRDKGGLDLGELADEAARRVRAGFWIGEAAPRLEQALGGRIPTTCAGTLEAAVAGARARAERGDTVLFSPAFASFDQFANYEERGERFRASVSAQTAVARSPGTPPGASP